MATIADRNSIQTLADNDLFLVYSQSNGESVKLSASNLAAWLNGKITSVDDKITVYNAPTATGFTVQCNDTNQSQWVVVTPLNSYATGTLKLPSVVNAIHGQEILCVFTQGVTTFTIDANGANQIGAPTTINAAGSFRLRYESVLKTWYRIS